MVYETDTYVLCHQLAESARDAYSKILEDAASEILYKNEHPLKWRIEKLKAKFFKTQD